MLYLVYVYSMMIWFKSLCIVPFLQKTNVCILIEVQLFFLYRYKTLVYLKYCFSGLAFPPGITEVAVG